MAIATGGMAVVDQDTASDLTDAFGSFDRARLVSE